MTLGEATVAAVELRSLFEALEIQRHGRAWSLPEIALGLVGDVGDLAKLVQGAAGVREISNLQSKLEHELADCLWAVLVLADRLGVDIEAAFHTTTGELQRYLRSELKGQETPPGQDEDGSG